MKDIFNPDSYTEKAMPISTALCRAIDDLGNLDEASNAVTECRKAYSEIYDKFFNSLTKEHLLKNSKTCTEMCNVGIWKNLL